MDTTNRYDLDLFYLFNSPGVKRPMCALVVLYFVLCLPCSRIGLKFDSDDLPSLQRTENTSESGFSRVCVLPTERNSCHYLWHNIAKRKTHKNGWHSFFQSNATFSGRTVHRNENTSVQPNLDIPEVPSACGTLALGSFRSHSRSANACEGSGVWGWVVSCEDSRGSWWWEKRWFIVFWTNHSNHTEFPVGNSHQWVVMEK